MKWFLRLFKSYRDYEQEAIKARATIVQMTEDHQKTIRLANELKKTAEEYRLNVKERTETMTEKLGQYVIPTTK